jgi:hypothetical protein
MKKEIFPVIFLIMLVGVSSFAQTDSTSRKKVTSAMGVYAEFGVLSNSTMTDMMRELKAQSVDPFNSYMSSLVLAHRVESKKWMMEHRIILSGSGNMHDEDKVDFKRANLFGIGIGLTGGPKLVNTSKINVYVPIGIDLMYYQMGIKSNPSASLNKLVNNPGTYQAVRISTKTINVNAGLGLDYKTGWFKKHYDSFYLSTRAAYHLSVLPSEQWRGANVQVNDLTSFKPNQLFLSVGIVASPKHMGKMWSGMK